MEKREYNTQGETTYFGLLVWNEKRGGISLIGPTVDKNNTLTFGVLKTFFPENTKFPYQSLRTSETDINYDWLEDNLGQRAIFALSLHQRLSRITHHLLILL